MVCATAEAVNASPVRSTTRQGHVVSPDYSSLPPAGVWLMARSLPAARTYECSGPGVPVGCMHLAFTTSHYLVIPTRASIHI